MFNYTEQLTHTKNSSIIKFEVLFSATDQPMKTWYTVFSQLFDCCFFSIKCQKIMRKSQFPRVILIFLVLFNQLSKTRRCTLSRVLHWKGVLDGPFTTSITTFLFEHGPHGNMARFLRWMTHSFNAVFVRTPLSLVASCNTSNDLMHHCFCLDRHFVMLRLKWMNPFYFNSLKINICFWQVQCILSIP